MDYGKWDVHEKIKDGKWSFGMKIQIKCIMNTLRKT